MFDTNDWKAERLNSLEGVALSDRAYNAVIGLTVLWGFALNFLLSVRFTDLILSINPWILVIGYFVVSFGSILLIHASDNPIASFLGFSILAIAMGALLVYGLQEYTTAQILLAVKITAIVTTIMLCLAVIRPSFFLGLGRTLLTALIVCLVVELVFRILLRFEMGWLDYVVALVFCGYIGYDWAVAQRYPKNLNNAVDSAADIYIDIINLFLRILSILGRGSSSSNSKKG